MPETLYPSCDEDVGAKPVVDEMYIKSDAVLTPVMARSPVTARLDSAPKLVMFVWDAVSIVPAYPPDDVTSPVKAATVPTLENDIDPTLMLGVVTIPVTKTFDKVPTPEMFIVAALTTPDIEALVPVYDDTFRVDKVPMPARFKFADVRVPDRARLVPTIDVATRADAVMIPPVALTFAADKVPEKFALVPERAVATREAAVVIPDTLRLVNIPDDRDCPFTVNDFVVAIPVTLASPDTY